MIKTILWNFQCIPYYVTFLQLDVQVSQGATLSKFMAKDTQFRYLRLEPAIAQCYSKLIYNENKWLNASGKEYLE